MAEKKKAAKKSSAPRKDDIVLIMGPYQGTNLKEFKSKDGVEYEADEMGKHLYVRTDEVTADGRVVFEWRGPVSDSN